MFVDIHPLVNGVPGPPINIEPRKAKGYAIFNDSMGNDLLKCFPINKNIILLFFRTRLRRNMIEKKSLLYECNEMEFYKYFVFL